ncbi:hypothetical protein, partial [Polymorphobacter multimanifer]|uniref:hypothetical protein n=1 Tax=Polymorphobacter multimanifer TaxID=1070431 RepID=UPI001A9C9AB7
DKIIHRPTMVETANLMESADGHGIGRWPWNRPIPWNRPMAMESADGRCASFRAAFGVTRAAQTPLAMREEFEEGGARIGDR